MPRRSKRLRKSTTKSKSKQRNKSKSNKVSEPSPETKFSKYLHSDPHKRAIVKITNPLDEWYGKTGFIIGCTPTRLIISVDYADEQRIIKDDDGQYHLAVPIVEHISRIPENFEVLYWPPKEE